MPSNSITEGKMMPKIHKKRIKIGELDIHYLTGGQGTPLIVIHGGSGGAKAWLKNMAELAANYTVYAPDLPGFGHSQSIDGDYFIPELTEFVDKFSQALGLDSFHLMGHSFGGGIVLHYALKFPQKIKKLVGKYDPEGKKKCNCIKYLELMGHGVENPQTEKARGGTMASGQNDPFPLKDMPKKDKKALKKWRARYDKRRRHPLGYKSFLGTEDKERGTLTSATKYFFEAIKALKCKDGITVEFYSCNAGHGFIGKVMAHRVADIVGGAVTVYEHPISSSGITRHMPYIAFPDMLRENRGSIEILGQSSDLGDIV